MNNFWGALKTTRDLTGFGLLAFPPYSQGGAGGEVFIDGRPVLSAQSRWYPYQVLRSAVHDGVSMQSAIRMVFENRGVLCRLESPIMRKSHAP